MNFIVQAAVNNNKKNQNKLIKILHSQNNYFKVLIKKKNQIIKFIIKININ